MRKMLVIAIFAALAALAQDVPLVNNVDQELVTKQVTEFRTNVEKVTAKARSFRGSEFPHQEVREARAMITRGMSPMATVPAPANNETFIWTTDELILTGYSVGNQNQISRLGVYNYNPGITFNQIAPVGDARNTVFATGFGYEGSIFRFDDPSGTGFGTNYLSYDGQKDLDAILPLSASQFVGNSAYGYRLLNSTVTPQGLSQPPASVLPYLGNGSMSLAKNSHGDIVSLDLQSGGIIWIQRKEKQYADILYGRHTRAVALAYDSKGQLYVAIAGQQANPDFNQLYQPSRLVKVVDNGSGNEATMVDVAVGGILNIDYSQNSLAISNGVIYFINTNWQGDRELLGWNIAGQYLITKIPAVFSRGMNSFALMPQTPAPTLLN